MDWISAWQPAETYTDASGFLVALGSLSEGSKDAEWTCQVVGQSSFLIIDTEVIEFFVVTAFSSEAVLDV